MRDFKDAVVTAAFILVILLLGFGVALADRYMDQRRQESVQYTALEARVVSVEKQATHLGERISKQRECMCARRPADVKDIQPPYGEAKR